MRIFQVRQAASGIVLWTGEAADEGQAVEAMAREAGFRNEADLPEAVSGSGLKAEQLFA